MSLIVILLYVLLQFIVTCISIVPQVQIDAIIDIYNSLNGPYWEYIDPYCQWNISQIKQGDLSQTCNMTTVENNLITVLDLSELYQSSAYGTLPESIYNITSLTQLYIFGDNIQGTISPKINQLSNLNILSFAFT